MKTVLLTLLLAGPIFTNYTHAQQSRAGVTVPTLEINLYARAMNGTMFLADGILQNFNDSFSPAVDNMDVRKFMNVTDNLAIKNGLYNLIVERRPMIRITDTVKLMLTGTRIAPYRFMIDPSVLTNTTINSFLKDKFLGTETPVSMTDVTNINFDITTDPLSRVADRFIIVYRNNLPVRFTDIYAVRNRDNSITATFKTANENNINTYAIEKSNDGITFDRLDEQMPTANNFGDPYYNYRDEHAALSAQWYRIKANNITGGVIYSDAVKVEKVVAQPAAAITVFPNPISNGKVNIGIVDQTVGVFKMQIINSKGQVIYSEAFNVQSSNVQKQIFVPGMTSGIYRLVLTGANGVRTVSTILAK